MLAQILEMPARPPAALFRAGNVNTILKHMPVDLAHHASGHEYKGSSAMYEDVRVDASRAIAVDLSRPAFCCSVFSVAVAVKFQLRQLM
jgi:hypothetical protein